jgi:hypothetical protein
MRGLIARAKPGDARKEGSQARPRGVQQLLSEFPRHERRDHS